MEGDRGYRMDREAPGEARSVIATIKSIYIEWRKKRLRWMIANGYNFLNHPLCVNDPEMHMLTRRAIDKCKDKLKRYD